MHVDVHLVHDFDSVFVLLIDLGYNLRDFLSLLFQEVHVDCEVHQGLFEILIELPLAVDELLLGQGDWHRAIGNFGCISDTISIWFHAWELDLVIAGHNNVEYVFACLWMIFGVGFYSYTIGNMT